MTRTNSITPSDLASIGEGHLAYLRRMSSDDIRARFPSAQSIRPGLKLWALFSADGTPLAVSDDRGSILASATENELLTVSIH
ncbi:MULTISPECIES: DUF1150 domain-containing protein [Aureimonas]|jgi:hypothetical protein|uniref:DUF1150 domain-containing protein n=1 Tax=Aureimonas phyllosphaerae TaxID=1166078 RepID=A0A7W6FVQ4_9HYPH|nr:MULTISPECIES: DUF1150 domain-containing protein [Aureimonas]KQQ78908.1 hypothetical protein ASF65_15140 [Aureimonas sp. Leaf324]MBB3937443.1 hypothetical protein [Aureimonas phyllosphaerae]MBB3961491.1 hypothetical protein [Aureimonas phyllosphaerae]SFF38680.1 hypothetical protein SAMN05216566_11096 [Aureimonas phyllosphaerae]